MIVRICDTCQVTEDPARIETKVSHIKGRDICLACFEVSVKAQYCCHKCFDAGPLKIPRGMILCRICGNKRCPKASDHDLACTGSNEQGQPGSVYA